MSIGSQFLSRVLTEAKKDKKAGFEFDRSVEAMKRAMRVVGGETNIADKIAEIAAMAGISGMYLNKPDVRESVLDAAQALRTKSARVRAFLAIHSTLSKFHGITQVVEAKEVKTTSEEDLEGNAFQQLVEEVLVALGIPEEMVSGEAKAGVKAGLKRTIAKLRSDSDVRAAFVVFARLAGIKIGDGIVGPKKSAFAPAIKEAKEAEDEVAPTNLKDVLATARAIMMNLGVDLADETVVRVVNDAAMSRAIKAACRDPKVKRGMAAFLRAIA